jgi:hypothetical protein
VKVLYLKPFLIVKRILLRLKNQLRTMPLWLLSETEEKEPEANHYLSSLERTAGHSMSTVWGHTMNHIGNHRVLVFGGQNKSDMLSDVCVFDFNKQKWIQPVNLPDKLLSGLPRTAFSYFFTQPKALGLLFWSNEGKSRVY